MGIYLEHRGIKMRYRVGVEERIEDRLFNKKRFVYGFCPFAIFFALCGAIGYYLTYTTKDTFWFGALLALGFIFGFIVAFACYGWAKKHRK